MLREPTTVGRKEQKTPTNTHTDAEMANDQTRTHRRNNDNKSGNNENDEENKANKCNDLHAASRIKSRKWSVMGPRGIVLNVCEQAKGDTAQER